MITPEEERLIRMDERLRVLRQVRNVAANMDKDLNNDPYLWGYGAGQIVKHLNGKLREARFIAGRLGLCTLMTPQHQSGLASDCPACVVEPDKRLTP